MAWSTPRTWSVNEVLTAANMNTYISDDLRWLGTDFPRATATGTLSVATGSAFQTPTGSWSSASPNVGGMYTSSAMYLTVPTAGAYIFTALVIFSTNATGKRGVVISSSAAGAGTIWAEDVREPTQNTELTVITITTPPIQLSAFQQVHLGIRQNSGSSMNVSAKFGGHWIGT